ncbi:MAG TPA: hypothetical protein VM554_14265 [Acidisarcina sp.]|nr:hypothetical protein [Acidisarcina sp.]
MFSRRFASLRTTNFIGTTVMLAALVAAVFAIPARAADPASGQTSVLHAADATKLLPASVFYRGQTAPVQSRNSGGVRFADGMLVLICNVDNSGYSSGVQQKFTAYLLTEVPLDMGGKHLPAGAYGLGIVSGQVMVTDIGANDVLQTKSTADANLKRPMPLQVIADATAGHYRVYFGRDYFVLSRAK